jgi:hypothetical protein
MYAVYNYKAGSTAANVSADIIKLLTGETNLANLSTDCVTANSSIISTVAAGWTVHDASAGTNIQVIKALCQDGTTYKYYRFGCTSTTVCEGTISEGWNAGTHTATNGLTTGIAAVQSSWNATAGGFFYVYATQKNIILYSYHTSNYQAINGMMVFEHTRDTVPSGYPCFCVAYGINNNTFTNSVTIGTAGWAHPRYKSALAAGDVLATFSSTQAGAGMGPLGAFYYSSSSLAFYRDGSEAVQVVVYKMGFGTTPALNTNLAARHLGEGYDILLGHSSLGAPRDEITISSKTYVLHGNAAGQGNSAYYFLVPKE